MRHKRCAEGAAMGDVDQGGLRLVLTCTTQRQFYEQRDCEQGYRDRAHHAGHEKCQRQSNSTRDRAVKRTRQKGDMIPE